MMRGIIRVACVLATVVVTSCAQTVEQTATPPPSADQPCSASSLSTALPDQDLPDAVARMRRDIAVAAANCDYEELEDLALAGGRDDGFTFTYGAPEGGPAKYWRTLEESDVEEGTIPPLEMLVKLLGTKHDVSTQGPETYTWPAIAVKERPIDADWDELAEIFPAARIERMKKDSAEHGIGYLDYRVGITGEGDWVFYVAGD